MKCHLWTKLLQFLLVLALPVVLLAADLRIVTGRWFVRWEYGKAGFPADPYGLTAAERTALAEVCVDYLATGADISLLADLRLPDASPAFNERELRHMEDVQAVYGRLMGGGLVAGVVLAGGIVALLASPRTRRFIPGALLGGSLFSLGLLASVSAVMVLQWQEFFTTFHRIFFPEGTWTFPMSNTLIRLFPMRLWIDVAVVIVVVLLVGIAVVGLAGWIGRRLCQESAG